MKRSKEGWYETGLYCTHCNEVVTQRTWPNGLVMMRCDCIKKAGHLSILPAQTWIDKECRNDVKVRNGAILSSYSTAYFD